MERYLIEYLDDKDWWHRISSHYTYETAFDIASEESEKRECPVRIWDRKNNVTAITFNN